MLSSDAGISSMPSSMISNISETDHNSSTTMIATNNSQHQEYGNMGCQVSKGEYKIRILFKTYTKILFLLWMDFIDFPSFFIGNLWN